ncbi:response regulator [Anditalea andensis]|uniref:Response regulatory domain-containing protein n=1 Tax=Anditalea andensis TaxID=1048983 RepID=A0A074LME8_9BACT|nr:response regulator [Anditalea andensis]KEO75062.1 hypothetical protein EL17_05155 [Anditalea andensis]
MKILYIEDNNINRLVFETLLSPKAEVACAETGPIGLDLAMKECYEIVVIDLNLNDPEMDGFDVIRTLKDDKYDLRCSSKLYALTSYVGTEWEEKCLEAGFDGFFNKPLDPNKILENHQLND